MSNYSPAPLQTPASASRFGVDPYADHIGVRLLEFFADTTPWQRRLWDVGSELVAPRDPDDAKDGRGAVAADRLAALVACSWPRSELTGLAHRHRPSTPDRLALDLRDVNSNRERSRLVADALVARRRLALSDVKDMAAESRMMQLIDSPRATLRDVRAYVTTTLRRLYRQRNIVVHGGATGALALDVTLRTAAPLVGAGLDRIVHAELADGVPALDLAERAILSLELIGGQDGPHVADLLEFTPAAGSPGGPST